MIHHPLPQMRLAVILLLLSLALPVSLSAQSLFASHRDYAVGSNPDAIDVGDFNGDGRLDLAVANWTANTVSILLATTGGGFLPASTYPAGTGPLALAVADFNRDGRLDVVAANYGFDSAMPVAPNIGTTVSVLLGNGNGTFQSARTYDAGVGPYDVAAGDFNRDGLLDLVVANLGPERQRGLTLSVLFGNGNGSFQSPIGYYAGRGPNSVAIADFNADGIQDFAAGIFEEGTIAVLLGNANGTFRSPSTVSAGPSPWDVVAGDLNGDAVQDLAVVNHFMENLSVFFGNGDGTFRFGPSMQTGARPAWIALSDYNGDGLADMAVANFYSHSVSAFLGTGGGNFAAGVQYPVGHGPASVVAADLNGDARADLATANYDDQTVSVLLNNSGAPPPTRYGLSVAKAGAGTGTVTSSSNPSSPSQINCGSTCSAEYDSGTVVTLSAQPAAGSTFTGWTGCDAVSGGVCTVNMTAARSVTATFGRQRFVLSVTKESMGFGTGTVTSTSSPSSATQINCGNTCSASYDASTVVTLTATPTPGSSFVRWQGCDAVSGNTCTVTMNGSRSVNAAFLRTMPL
jgi:hypothetical protein